MMISPAFKIGAVVLLLAASYGAVFYWGYASRQDEVDEGIKALITCQALTNIQNAAVRQLKAAGDAQTEKILKAQAAAEKLRQRPLVKREPPPDDCGSAMVWGKERAEELSRGWK